jgi:glutathione S-transferase
MRPLEPMVYHLAISTDWDEALLSGQEYRTSTVGVTLAEQGFIHCSFADQVQATADRFYAGRSDVVLLTVDPALLTSPIRVDEVGVDAFPHVYGPLNPSAVRSARVLAVGSDGTLDASVPPIA